jgi:hypothetical protein
VAAGAGHADSHSDVAADENVTTRGLANLECARRRWQPERFIDQQRLSCTFSGMGDKKIRASTIVAVVMGLVLAALMVGFHAY